MSLKMIPLAPTAAFLHYTENLLNEYRVIARGDQNIPIDDVLPYPVWMSVRRNIASMMELGYTVTPAIVRDLVVMEMGDSNRNARSS